MSQEPDPALINQLSAQLRESQQRILRLERDAERAALDVTELQGVQGAKRNAVNEASHAIEQGIEAAHDHLQALERDVAGLTNKFKDIIKKDQLKEFSAKLDDVKFEEYITREEFDELLASRPPSSRPQSPPPQSPHQAPASSSAVTTSPEQE